MKLSLVSIVAFAVITSALFAKSLKAAPDETFISNKASADKNNPCEPVPLNPKQQDPSATSNHGNGNTYNYYGRFRYIPPASRVVVSESRASIWSAVLLAAFTGALVVTSALQWLNLQEAYLSEHRPRLGIRRIALLNIPEEMHQQITPVEIHLRLINRGGSAAKVIEGNVTVTVDKPSTEGGLAPRETILPPFDIQTGMPRYTAERDSAKNRSIEPAETYTLVRIVPQTTSTTEAADLYLALHRWRNDPTRVFHVFGYFKYRTASRFGVKRTYYTAFCRRFEPNVATFVPINNEDYEYEY
jgi:hypothetical protein